MEKINEEKDKGGRPGYGETLRIIEGYNKLKDTYFDTLDELLKSKNTVDKRFAMEQLSKAFIKMIPQQLDNKVSGDLTIQIVNYADTSSLPAEKLSA